MLSLIRRHEIIEDLNCDWECIYGQCIVNVVSEWEIGKFETLEDIEDYLVIYHNYNRFDNRDMEKIKLFLNLDGVINLPINGPTYLDNVIKKRFIIAKC